MNDDKEPQGNPWIKSAMIWAGVIVALLLFVSIFDSRSVTTAGDAIAYSEFRQKVQEGSVKEVSIAPDRISGTLSNGDKFNTIPVTDPSLPALLDDFNVKYSGKAEEQPSFWMILLYQSLPFLLILGIAFFVLRQMQKGSGSGAMGFGKSKAKLLTEKQGKVTFDDVAGIDEAREELQEIVEFLKDPSKFARLGGQIPKGALLVGPPGSRSSPFPVPISWKCSSALAPAACATCSSRQRKMRPASSSLTKSMRSDAIVALALAMAMTSASRR
jgi:cell division protease FtsH